MSAQEIAQFRAAKSALDKLMQGYGRSYSLRDPAHENTARVRRQCQQRKHQDACQDSRGSEKPERITAEASSASICSVTFIELARRQCLRQHVRLPPACNRRAHFLNNGVDNGEGSNDVAPKRLMLERASIDSTTPMAAPARATRAGISIPRRPIAGPTPAFERRSDCSFKHLPGKRYPDFQTTQGIR